MKQIGFRLVCTAFAFLATASNPLAAQGRDGFFNVESPQVNPLALTEFNGSTLLFVCNTPDDSLELYEVFANASPVFLDRAPVGLRPITVKTRVVDGELNWWTCNFLGDSITGGSLQNDEDLVVNRTRNVGDEPMDFDFYEFIGGSNPGLGLIVSLQSSSAFGIFNAESLQPVTPASLNVPGSLNCGISNPNQQTESIALVLNQTVQEVALANGTTIANPLLDGVAWGLKEPRAVRVLQTPSGVDFAVFLGFKGGDLLDGAGIPEYPWNHDQDLLFVNLQGGFPGSLTGSISIPVADNISRGINSLNHQMRISSNGDIYVVGGEALNFGGNSDNVNDVSGKVTGFMESTLWRLPFGGLVPDRDTNRVNLNALVPDDLGTPGDETVPVNFTDALAMPTDLVLVEDTNNLVERIFLTAQSSDRIGVYTRDASNPSQNLATWLRSTIDMDAPDAAHPSVKRGPRALVHHDFGSGSERLFVMNRFDNTITRINLGNNSQTHFNLQNDPQPDHVLLGRSVLYDAELSGNGFVSCASCHHDGRTDDKSWRLGSPAGEISLDKQFIYNLMGGPDSTVQFQHLLEILAGSKIDPLTEDKREMITQSLQGLMNYDVDLNGATQQDKQTVRDYFSNGPYHWRGDKPTFLDFNEAFMNLMGGSELSAQRMEEYEDFVFSINYPPNPKQPKDRNYSPTEDCGTGDFIGAETGLELYHTRPLTGFLGGLSCVQCHALPEGSNNRIPTPSPTAFKRGYISGFTQQGIESAALRGLFQKEGVQQANGADDSTAFRVGHFGLNHFGSLGNDDVGPVSINIFLDELAGTGDLGAPDLNQDELTSIKQLVHEFDWGVAPAVGQTVTIVPGDFGSLPADKSQTLDLMEAQARLGNCSVAVQGQLFFGGTVPARLGLVYVPPVDQYLLVQSAGVSLFPRNVILAAVGGSGDRAVFVATPLGEEYRVANTVGQLLPLGNGPPASVNATNVQLVSNSANTSIAALTGNTTLPVFLNPNDNNPPTDVDPTLIPGTQDFDATDGPFNRLLRLYQTGLFTESADSGVPSIGAIRHEPPRRIRIEGEGILPGAQLHLYTPIVSHSAQAGPSDPSWDWPTEIAKLNTPSTSDDTVAKISLPLYLVAQPAPAGTLVWETAAELSPVAAYTMMLGGPGAPGVAEAKAWVVWDSFELTEWPPATVLSDLGLSVIPTLNEPVGGWGQPYAQSGADISPFDVAGWNRHWLEVENPVPGNVLTVGEVRLRMN